MGELGPVFRALADERRRLVLSCVRQHDTLTLADAAEYVAREEAGERIAEIPADRVKEIYFSLYHTHVPILEDASLVRYEQEPDLVSTTDETAGALEGAREELDRLLEGSVVPD